MSRPLGNILLVRPGRMNLVSLGLGIVSLLLLAINAVGLLRRPSRKSAVYSVRQLLAALPAAEAGQVEPFCEKLAQLLAERFDHGYGRYTPWSNYVCWLAGLAVPRLADIQNTELLLRYSEQALCSQVAQAFVDVAGRRAVRARLAALPGHVVAEAYYDGSWHGFDADYGVVYADPTGRIMAVDDLLASPSLASGIYAGHRLPRDNREVLEIFARGNVTYLPVAAHAVPRIAYLQRVAEWTKWLLPLALLLAAAAIGWLG